MIWLDIALLDLKIDVEYDGTYWHKLNGEYKDKERDKFLKKKGWKIIRIKDGDEDIIKILNQRGLKL